MRILLLSSDRALTDRYRAAAEWRGAHRLTCVENVPQALERMFRLPFDALISDDRFILHPFILNRPMLWPVNLFLLVREPLAMRAIPEELTYCFPIESDPDSVLSVVGSFPCGQTRRSDTDVRISHFLQTVGVPVSLYGFGYLFEAIRLLTKQTRLAVGGIMNDLYEILAMESGVGVSVVEHAMRHAIDAAWMRADVRTLEAVFGYTVDAERAAPSNAAFVFRAADHLIIKSGR